MAQTSSTMTMKQRLPPFSAIVVAAPPGGQLHGYLASMAARLVRRHRTHPSPLAARWNIVAGTAKAKPGSGFAVRHDRLTLPARDQRSCWNPLFVVFCLVLPARPCSARFPSGE